MKVIVGNSGLVGNTLCESINFDFMFNSKNINDFSNYDINGCDLYLSCLPATKWLVNQNVTDDINNILNLIEIFKSKTYKRIFLISTIDVYTDSPQEVNEDYYPNFLNCNYGSNRLLFESLVRSQLKYYSYKIFRLPALFNKNIKKNILFDLINDNNVNNINTNSSYQWYNLDNLYKDMMKLDDLYPNDEIFNLFTEPIDTQEIVNLFPKHKDKTFYGDKKIVYNYKTKYSKSGYFKNYLDVLNDIKKMVNEFINK
jgi:nucleoside-diphosphate-sugar epimerase